MGRDWRGPIAFVLAVGVSVALVSGVLTSELTPGAVTTQEVSFLSTLGGAVVGALAAYLGIRHAGENGDTPPTPTPPDDEET